MSDEKSSLFQSIKPMLNFYRCFYLAHVSVIEDNNLNLKFCAYKFKTTYLITCFILLSIISAAFVQSLYVYVTVLKPEDFTLGISYVAELLTVYLGMLLSIINLYNKRETIAEILHIMHVINNKFSNIYSDITHNKTSSFIKYEFIFIFAVLLFHLLCRVNKTDNIWNCIVMFVGIDLPFFILTLYISMFTNLVLLLNQRILCLNNYLKSLNFNKHLIFILPRNASLNDLPEIMLIRTMIYECSIKLNFVFEKTILIISAFMFQNILSEFYQMYIKMSNNQTWNSDILMIIKWILNDYLTLFLMSMPCEAVKNEVNILIIIYSIMNYNNF